MIRSLYRKEWRTQNRTKRLIYSRYMTWLERGGYLFCVIIIGLFVSAFFYRTTDYITADAVPIVAAHQDIKFSDPVLIVRVLQPNLSRVRPGQPLLEIVSGKEEIARYRLWDALQNAKGAGSRLMGDMKVAKPASTLIQARSSGVFRCALSPLTSLDSQAVAAQIVDYSRLEMAGSFKGDTVYDAKVGEPVRISDISTDSLDKTVVRASGGPDQMISRSIAGDGVTQVLDRQLKNLTVQVRQDLPLTVDSVSSVEVDSDLGVKKSDQSGFKLDPPADLNLTGTVTEGQHMAELQLSKFPSEVADPARAALNRVLDGKVLTSVQGASYEVDRVDDSRFVVKVKASYRPSSKPPAISGTVISRSFDATITLASPPAFLVNEVMDADRDGRVVTAKVEIETGRRPFVFTLFKRS